LLSEPRVVVGVTGATGAGVAASVLRLLGAQGVERHLIVSPAGRRSAHVEIEGVSLEALAERVHGWRDIGAPVASGSFPFDAMAVVPCSVRTLSAIAYGQADNLIVRCADVALKERRRLVLGFRETPLHLGHLRAMTAVTEAGAIVAPLMPAFYTQPATVADLIDHLAHRICDLLGFRSPDAPTWGGEAADGGEGGGGGGPGDAGKAGAGGGAGDGREAGGQR
jgi:polyprenyl P-hydroxybenzoate/phenylacrylic acid decarboxylase-like protein